MKFLFNDEMTINVRFVRFPERRRKLKNSLFPSFVKLLNSGRKSTSEWIELRSSDYAIPKDPFVASLPCILNDFLSDHVRRAWLQNSRSLVFEFIDKYRELLCRLTVVYRGFVSKRSCFRGFHIRALDRIRFSRVDFLNLTVHDRDSPFSHL